MAISATARRTALLAAPVLVVAGFAIGGGERSAAGAALGVAMVVLFFAGGRAPMFLASTTPPGPLFLLISMGYVLRIVAMLAVFKGLSADGWVDKSAIAATVIAGALAWTAYLVHAHLTSQQPTLEIAKSQQVVPS